MSKSMKIPDWLTKPLLNDFTKIFKEQKNNATYSSQNATYSSQLFRVLWYSKFFKWQISKSQE